MTGQGVDIDVLDGLAVGGVMAIHAAATLSAAEIDPIGSPIAGAAITGTIHEGLEKQRSIAVEIVPILGQAMSGERKDFAGQPLDVDPGEHEESGVTDDELESAFAFEVTPADPGVARGHLPGGAGEEEAGEPATRELLRIDEVAEVGAERDAIAEVVVAVDELLEDDTEGLIAGLDEVQRERLEVARAAGDRRLRIADVCRFDLARAGGSRGPKLGKVDQPVVLESSEKGATLLLLELAGGAFPIEEFAYGSGELGQAEVGKVADGVNNKADVHGREDAAGKLQSGRKHGVAPGIQAYHRRVGGDCPAKNANTRDARAIEVCGPKTAGSAWLRGPKNGLTRPGGYSVREIKSTI